MKNGGAGRDRTDDLKLAKLPLYQLSYSPKGIYVLWYDRISGASRRSMVGLGGLEPPTSRLSGVRSNHLSYRPAPPEIIPYGNRSRALGPERRQPSDENAKRRRRHIPPELMNSWFILKLSRPRRANKFVLSGSSLERR